MRNSDQLLVLKDGALVKRGIHEDLVDDGGLYETLWRIHLGETDIVPEIDHEGESPN
ncbi:hypothetical protein [Haladaptatus halobius]|uniref:hypothetical protein n=1 Tax=Haladaptatus halobius TaxID=2884875 RepID=UPI0026E581B7|nr:hypothetical protein [Haladaptatus halobius]